MKAMTDRRRKERERERMRERGGVNETKRTGKNEGKM